MCVLVHGHVHVCVCVYIYLFISVCCNGQTFLYVLIMYTQVAVRVYVDVYKMYVFQSALSSDTS